MGNKEDWEELEKWAKNEKTKITQTYSMQFDEQDMQKRMDSISNCLRRVSKTVKFIFIIIALIVGFIILVNLNVNISNFRTSVNADVDSLKDMYGIKTNIISQDTDENGNGKYIFELKNAWQKEGQFIVPINIGIQINEDIIYPYNGMYQTADDIRTNANNYINEIYMNQ